MKQTLYKLAELFANNKIEFIVTGTTALWINGVYPNYAPKDIDIKVYNLSPENRKLLYNLECVYGAAKKSEKYEQDCYTFGLGGYKINAIVMNTKYGTDKFNLVKMPALKNINDECIAITYPLAVQTVNGALIDKLKLGRRKDADYIIGLIRQLTELYNANTQS